MPSLGGGGAERAMLNLAGGLLDAGFRVDLLLANATGPYLPQVAAQVRIIDLARGRVLTCLPGLVRYLRAHRPQVFLSTPFRANIVVLLARMLARSPVRVFVREAATLSETLRTLPPWGAWKAVTLARLIYPRADGIIAVSEGVASDLQALLRLNPRLLKVINNPVVTRDLLAMADAALEHPWFHSGALPVILGVGRLAPQKDFDTLIKSFALVRRQLECRLMILGEGPERQALQQLVAELGLGEAVALPGFVPNPFPYMRQARLLVLSSRHEGLPNVLIQAMALGTAVIATDCPSGPAEILDQGNFGPLVAIGDTDAMAAAMVSLLTCPPSAASKMRLMERAANYHVDRILQDYLRFFFPPAWTSSHPILETAKPHPCWDGKT
ncbi:MAG TPA: glycosyl transferase [Desulfuromonas sp.]|nr:glycosyl transferase [Desulfuromonas sp.]